MMAAMQVLKPDEEKLFHGQPKGFPFGDFDLEDVMLPEDDDMGVPSDDEEQEEVLQTETGFGNVLGARMRAMGRRPALVAPMGASRRRRRGGPSWLMHRGSRNQTHASPPPRSQWWTTCPRCRPRNMRS
jgi:hypothetical protein